MTNEKSKQIYQNLMAEIRDSREAEPQSLQQILEEQDESIYKNAILCQVLLFICSNLWKKQFGTDLTSEKLLEIQKAVLKTK